MGATVGIHLVWTTYGTWLPGDPTKPGHWSPMFDVYGRLVRAGKRINLPDDATHRHMQALMGEAAKVLSDDEREIVASVIGSQIAPALAGGSRSTVIVHACAIEPTHVHLLVGPIDEDIDRFTGRFKGMTSSALLTHHANHGRQRIWTTGFWRVFLFEVEAMAAVREYIENHNMRRSGRAAPYGWIRQDPG